MFRVEFAHSSNQKTRSVAVVSKTKEDSIQKVLAVAKNKLKLKKAPLSLALDGTPVCSIELFWANIKDGSLVVVANEQPASGTNVPEQFTTSDACTVTTIESNGNLILHLKYQSATMLQQALKRPHIYYEKKELKGPLKGINFPVESWIQWAEEVYRSAFTSADTISQDLQVLDLANNDASRIRNIDYRALFTSLELQALDFGLGEQWSFVPETGKLLQNTKIEYVIAHTASDRSTFVHEWAHAIFYLRKPYRDLCESVFNSQASESFRAHVAKELVQLWNYDESVVLDEFQAYCVEGPVVVFGKKWSNEVKLLQSVLRAGVGDIPPY
ncbi:hypothetical protein BDR26DRAFT_862359 [Obelidium mucronatum]|nr:hypothetical protein BDR26DRAFT_862359 [Obelidium mucronatum]